MGLGLTRVEVRSGSFSAQLEPNCCRLPQPEQSLIALGRSMQGRCAAGMLVVGVPTHLTKPEEPESSKVSPAPPI